MKKISFILLMVFAFCISSNAQNVKNDGKPYAFYCQIVGNENLIGQLRLKLLWDNQKEENDIRDKDGNKVEFQSMVDVMNYMSKRGWEYVECNFFGANGKNTAHYVFRKMVTNDSEAKEDLYFKSDFNKK